MGIISTNIDSKGIKNNNFNFSNETSKNLENIKTKLNFTSKAILNINQRMSILEKKIIYLFNQPKNGYKNNYNPEELKGVMDYYENAIQKSGNNNDNPVEIFEDVNNHVEDIRQEVLNCKSQNLKRDEIIEKYKQMNNIENENMI